MMAQICDHCTSADYLLLYDKFKAGLLDVGLSQNNVVKKKMFSLCVGIGKAGPELPFVSLSVVTEAQGTGRGWGLSLGFKGSFVV